jgi:hypothetical protein
MRSCGARWMRATRVTTRTVWRRRTRRYFGGPALACVTVFMICLVALLEQIASSHLHF